jgi:hypothetical protein
MKITLETIANLLEGNRPSVGDSRSKILSQIEKGLLPKPGRCNRIIKFNAAELDVTDTAVMLGYDSDQVKDVVTRIHAERTSLDTSGDELLNELRAYGRAAQARAESLAA